MKILDKRIVVTILITFVFLIGFSISNYDYSYASSLGVPTIENFSKSTIENNALKVEIKSNNSGFDYSFELYNVTTGKKNVISGSANSYTYQKLEAGKIYKIKIRACSNSAKSYICSAWSKGVSAVPGTIPSTPSEPNTPDDTSTPDPEDLKGVKEVTLSKTTYVYNGKDRTPSVKVIDDDGKTLSKDIDYVVKYDDVRSNIGTYKVIVTGKGNYSFNEELSYKIKLGTPEIWRVMNTQDRIDLNYYEVTNQVSDGSGYQVAYKKKSASKWTKLNTNNIGITIPKNFNKKKFKSSTKYSFKVRAYNTINNKKVYSSWSKAITQKTLSKNTKYYQEKISVSIKNYSNKYTGKNIKPKVTVKNYKTKKTLKKGTDYTLSYPSSCKKVGTYFITVKGKGKYAKNYPQYIKYKIVK